MKALVFGGNGRLGQILVAHLKARSFEVEAPSHADCELSVRGAALSFVRLSGATHVFNCAAMSSLEGCADDRARAMQINANAPFEMALACREQGARFVHVSTDYVLDGSREGLKSESDPLCPLSVYARSKAEAERAVLGICPTALVVRVSWLCGNPHRPGFIEKTVAKILAGQSLAAIVDKYSLPTDVEELARNLIDAAGLDLSGVVQACATGSPVSWHDMAAEAARVVGGLRPELQAAVLTRQKLADISFFKEPRPRHTAMSNARLAENGFVFSSVIQTIDRAVSRFLTARTREEGDSSPVVAR